MFKIQLVPMLRKTQKLVIEADDLESTCLKEIEDKIDSLDLPDGEIIFVEFLSNNHPAIAMFIGGLLLERYSTIAVAERPWDCFAVVLRRPDSPFGHGISI